MFTSAPTARNNIGYSTISQELADAQAVAMDSNNCNDCYNCYNCYNCNNCKTQPILQIQGLRWKIYATDTELIIGCQRHTFERWKSFSDPLISIMAPGALEFWISYKDLIFGMLERAQAAQAAKNLPQIEE